MSPETKSDAQASETATAPTAQEVVGAFGRASPVKRTLMIAGGVLVLGTSPYWAPAAWRSRRVRKALSVSAKTAFVKWFA